MSKQGLFSTDFKFLWPGQFVSQMGTSVHAIGFSYYLKSASESASLIGTVSFFAGMLALLTLPIAGVLCDSYSRRTIILICDFLSGLLIAGLAAAFLLFQAPAERVVLLCATLPLLGILTAIFRPAFGAMLPDLVGREHIAQANSLYKGGARLGDLIGSVSGGLIYRAFGPTILFAFNAASYFFAYAMMRCIPNDRISTPAPPQAHAVPKRLNVIQNYLTGLNELRRIPGAETYLFLAVGINVCAAPILIFMPFHATNQLGGDAVSYASLMASLSFGIFLGYLAAGVKVVRRTANSKRVTAVIMLMCSSFIAFSLAEQVVTAMACLFIAGLANGYWSIYFETGIQTQIPKQLLGRVFATLGLASGIAVPIATLIAGVLVDIMNQDTSILFFACGIGMTMTATGLYMFSPGYRTFFEKLGNQSA